MRISVIVPVRNEARSIRELLDSLLNQTRMPDEIVITDGGSSDGTPEIIEGYVSRGFPVKLIRERLALPGRGRNLAAAQASCEWLAFIDAGIRPAPDWLASLAAQTDKDTDLVYGNWEPVISSFFHECAAIAYVPPPVKTGNSLMRPRFIASTLMRRSVWQSVGGFPEHLRSAEDLLFMNMIARDNFRAGRAPDAMVHWQLQPSIWKTFRRFVKYSRNNIRAGLWSNWQGPVSRRYFLVLLAGPPAIVLGRWWLISPALVWLALMIARGLVAIWRNRFGSPAKPLRNVRRLFVLVPLLAVLDLATLVGTIQWVLKDKLHLGGKAVSQENGT